jgi:selenophosphate synthetase-related protein
VTIKDNDVVVQPGKLQFVSSIVQVDESAQAVVLTISRLGGHDGELVVNYITTNGTAIAGRDYVETTGKLTWTEGNGDDKTVEVALTEDTLVESDETFTINLTNNTTGADLGYATVTIKDNDIAVQPGRPQLAVSSVKVDESAQTATLTISRFGGHDGKLVVNYATTNGTAIAGRDYVEMTGKLTWIDGDSDDKTVEVVITEDTLVESDETFTINLTNNATAADLGPATVIIKDNDAVVQPGYPQFAVSTVQVDESAQTVALTISRLGGHDGKLVVNYTTTNGTAIAGRDYVETTGKLTWMDRDKNDQTITIQLTDDAAVENDETFTVTLSSEGSGANLGRATVFITDNDTTPIEPPPSPITDPIPPCPTRGSITVTCEANGQTLTNVTIAKGVSLANVVLAGTIHNHGWISNSIIEVGAELIGGIVTGDIINKGTMINIEFRGASLTGGTLSGDITNNSPIGGTFKDVHLTANTCLSGGKLQGLITGDDKAPARLKNLEVKENSHLSGVILSNTVQLSDNVELTELLPALPQPCAALPTAIKRIDLSKDIFESGNGILATINALADLKNNNWVITQSTDCGFLQLTRDTLRFAVQPISVTSTSRSTGIERLEQQRVRFTTDTGLAILSYPAVQAPHILQTGLAKRGLPQVVLQQNGNLQIPATQDTWFSARPAWLATEVDDDMAPEPGLFFRESPHLSGVAIAYVIFKDSNGQYRQQDFYPAPAQPETLTNLAVENSLVKFIGPDNKPYHGIFDYRVTTYAPLTTGTLQVEPIPDKNGDGKQDWMLIYPNGDKQIFFQRLP